MIVQTPSAFTFCPLPVLRTLQAWLLLKAWLPRVQDAEMMEQIDRDVLRTHPGLHFFSGDDGAAVAHREVRLLAMLHSAVNSSQAWLAL